MKSCVVMRPATSTPKLTAGLMWQPEVWPMPQAMATMVSPKAPAMPRTSIEVAALPFRNCLFYVHGDLPP
jgi:hypothetical protein